LGFIGMAMKLEQRPLSAISSAEWDALLGGDYPFMRHAFLTALEQSGAVSEQTGWQPLHWLITDDDQLVAALPLYIKSHSWGEYVFDHAWAQAYSQHGLAYYPKAVTAVPFTPCQGPRLLMHADANPQQVMALFLGVIQQLRVSSWHCLFPDASQLKCLQVESLIIREGVQFQWFNRDYRSFDEFLQALSASKRKMIKRERRKALEQDISLRRIAGAAVTAAEWQHFYRFYALTYQKRRSQPYLNPAFFQQLATTMPEQLLLVMAEKDQQPVAAALFFISSDTLYGRYWGCDHDYDALHFEACYYQGIAYCIEQGITRFDSGAQGEHKIARGFEPITTHSAHWIAHPSFAEAVSEFVTQERLAIEHYQHDAARYLPFKKIN
jgi:predicted N-acyltransferase